MSKRKCDVYYVLHFMNRPYVSFSKFIYVPETSIVLRNDDDYVVFKYPIFRGMNSPILENNWPFYLGHVKLVAGFSEAVKKCKFLNSNDEDISDSEQDSETNESPRARKRRRITSEGTDEEPNVPDRDFIYEEMLDTDFIDILRNELKLYEKQLTDLDAIKELLREKETLVKGIVTKLETYKSECTNNEINERYQRLKRLIKFKNKQINDLKMKMKRKMKEKMSTPKKEFKQRVETTTTWTLKCKQNTYGAFELIPKTGVYVNGVSLCYCIWLARSKLDLARMLLMEVYTKKALLTCNFANREKQLDGHAQTVLLDFVENCQSLEDVPRANVIRSLRRWLFNYNTISEHPVDVKPVLDVTLEPQ